MSVEESLPGTGPSGSSRRVRARALRWALVVLSACLLAASLRSALSQDPLAANIDFYQYWVVGRSLQAGSPARIYAPQERERMARADREAAQREAQSLGRPTRRLRAAGRREELGTYATPWLYTLFSWGVGGDYARDQTAYQTFCMALFLLSILAFGWLSGLPLAGTFLLGAFFLTGFEPTLSEIRVGNVNRIQLAFLASFLLLQSRRSLPGKQTAAGFVLALGILFKPNLATVAFFLIAGWLLTRQVRKLLETLLGLALGATCAVTLSAWRFDGLGIWSEWVREILPLLREFDHSLAKGNLSLVRLLKDGLGWGESYVLAPLFALTFFACLALGLRRKRPSAPEPTSSLTALDQVLVGVGALFPLLAADLAWFHYFLLGLPLGFFLMRSSGLGGSWSLRVPAALGLVLMGHRALAPWVDGLPTLVLGSLVLLGTLLLFGTASADAFRLGRRLNQGARELTPGTS